ncbi:TPA: LL-diaminopimelate aminotransferase [bacterium]|nr:LL-diaminopimelate aminotransferase [bacterium]
MDRRSEKLKSLPEYPFAKIDRLKEGVEKREVIDLGIGDPDLPTPTHIISALKEALNDPKIHRYPPYNGYLELRLAISSWYKNRFGVSLEPNSEILPLVGSKDGIFHIVPSIINPGDVVLVPDPGYPVYFSATILGHGVPRIVPLLPENNFLPNLSEIDTKGVKAMFINYPNNPTGAACDIEFLEKLVLWAKENDIIILFDMAYSEVYFEEAPPSILQIPGAIDFCLEFHSLSKTFNMTGWRIGFCVGNKDIIKALLEYKTNVDSGIFGAVQYAAISALTGSQICIEEMRAIYKKRMDVLVRGLSKAGFNVQKPKASFYIWMKIEGKSSDFSEHLLQETGVVCTPGVSFGKYGEEFVRFSVTNSDEKIDEAVNRIIKWKSSL